MENAVQTTWRQISRERIVKFVCVLSGTIWLGNIPDVVSIAACNQLEIVIEYCTISVRLVHLAEIQIRLILTMCASEVALLLL